MPNAEELEIFEMVRDHEKRLKALEKAAPAKAQDDDEASKATSKRGTHS